MKNYTLLILLVLFIIHVENVSSQSDILISDGGTVNVSTGDRFFDAGGEFGNDGNVDYTITLAPAVAGERVVLDFTMFKTHWNWLWDEEDALLIYDGPTATGNNIGKLMGDYTIKYNTGVTPYGEGVEAYGAFPAILKPTMFGATNPSGSLTLVFTNGYSSQWDGWEADIITYKPLDTPGCNIALTADTLSICPGEPVDLFASGSIVSAPINNDFNSGTIGTGWASTASVSFTTNVCATPSLDGSTYLWMQNAAGPRSLETNSMDVSSGGDISFEYRQARNNGDASPCESPDQGGGTFEGIYVEYSIDGGTTWTTFKYIFPNGTEGSFGAEGGLTGCGGYVKDWTKMAYPIPTAAQTASTKFRWIQAKVTSASTDNWGLDNVIISLPNPSVNTITIEEVSSGTILATSSLDSVSAIVNPTVTTSYKAIITNGVETCETTIVVVVNPCITCDAEVGTVAASTSGSTNNNGAALNEFILCDGDHFLADTLGGYEDANGVNPMLDYAIYVCDPNLALDPESDACFTSSFIETPPTVDEINNGGSSSDIMTYLAGIGETVTDNTVWFVPVTLSVSATNANQIDTSCYDLGNAYKVTYLNPITTTEVNDCNSGTAIVTISGGYPEFFSGDYNLTNTGSGTLSSSTVSSSGGTVTVSGLINGDTFSFTILDDNNCPITYSGTYTCFECGTCLTPDCNIAGPYVDYATAELGSNHCSEINDMTADAVNGATFTSYHQLTASSGGAVGLIVSVGVNSLGPPCTVTRTAVLYPIGGPCSGAGISATTTTANGSAFYNPEWFGLTANTDYVVEITFTVPAGCDMVDHCESYYDPFVCNAGIGTTTVVTSDNSNNDYILCYNEEVTISTTGYQLPDGATTAGIAYALFSCEPSSAFPDSDPCFLGEYVIGDDLTSINDGSFATAMALSNQTIWIVPITMDNIDSPVAHYDTNLDSCFSMGPAIEITYLNEINTTVNQVCSIGEVTVQISGGYPEFFSANYNITNNGDGNLSASTLSDHNGSVSLTGLINGDNYNLSILDDNGCQTAVVSGTYVSISIDTLNYVEPDCYGDGGLVQLITTNAVGSITYSLNEIDQIDNGIFTSVVNDDYIATVTDSDGCIDSTTVNVNGPDLLTFDYEMFPIDCYGDDNGAISFENYTGGDGSYSFSIDSGLTFQTLSNFTSLMPGDYHLIVTDNSGCFEQDMVSIIEPSLVEVEGEDDFVSLMENTTLSIDVSDNDVGFGSDFSIYSTTQNGNASILENGVIEYTPNIDFSGMDTLVYEICDSLCGSICDTVSVYFEVSDKFDIVIPDIFTPNGDGFNDVFAIPNEGLSFLRVEVYDRWGILIYEWDQQSGAWDGRTITGDIAADGTYYYVATIKELTGDLYVKNGSFTLLR